MLLDDLVRVPGTDIGIGLDAVVGLIPGIGDAGTTAVAGVILVDAVRNRVPLPVLVRMGMNLGLDTLLGLVPGVGDLADIAHRANRRNLRLLERVLADREETRQGSVVYLVVAAGIVAGTLAVLIAGLVLGLWVLLRLLGYSG
nr:DUF4112 domain-containing protein [Brooklawnia cerclae]